MSTERDKLAAELWKHHYEDFTMTHDGREKSYCQCGAVVYPNKSLVQHQAEVVLAHLKPREVATAAELDALPVGSVVLDQSGTAWNKTGVRIWWVRGVTIIGGNPAELLPATVIHEGDPDA